MRTTYYVAASLDGFIATPDGKVDWLDCVGDSGHSSYTRFFESVDCLVMGRNSYDFVLNSGYPWHYGEKPCWVMTHRELKKMSESVIPTSQSPTQIIEEARSRGLSHLWIVGGSETASAFLGENLLDSMVVSIIPILLSEGIPLFKGPFDQTLLKLYRSESFANGIVEITYDLTEKHAAKKASPKIHVITGGAFEQGVFAGEEFLDLLDEVGAGVRDKPGVEAEEVVATLQEIWPQRKRVAKKKPPGGAATSTTPSDTRSTEPGTEPRLRKPDPDPALVGFLSTVMRREDYDGSIAVIYGLDNLVEYQKTEGPVCDLTDERQIIQFGFWTGDFGDGDAWCYDIGMNLIRCARVGVASDFCDEIRMGSYGVHDNFHYFVAHLRCSARMRGWI